MKRSRRIILAVEPSVLEGALATLLRAGADDEVVQLGRRSGHAFSGRYDAAVVSNELPAGVEADVVVTLPDTRGSGGTGTVRNGTIVEEVSIRSAERVVELIEQYTSGSSGVLTDPARS